MTEEEAVVVPSKTVPQGMAALLAFNPSAEISENEEGMTDALQHVKTGQITFAVRDTSIDGLEIEKDDFMGIADGKIVVKHKDRVQAAKDLLEGMIDEDSEILTILKGEDAAEEEVDSLISYIEDKYEDIEVELHDGKQPLYSFIFAIE